MLENATSSYEQQTHKIENMVKQRKLRVDLILTSTTHSMTITEASEINKLELKLNQFCLLYFRMKI